MKTLLLSVALCVAAFLLSCGGYSTMWSARHFTIGKSIEEVVDLVGEAKLNYEINFASKPDKKYLIHIYVMVTGQVETPYLCAYENKKLIYWGYPWEFTRHSDPILNEIGAAALAAYD